jgi:hypothetical protein
LSSGPTPSFDGQFASGAYGHPSLKSNNFAQKMSVGLMKSEGYMMNTKLLALLAATLFATGCASNKMIDAPEQEVITPPADKAQVIFLRSSFVGSAIQATIYDATGGGTEFIGILSNDKMLSYTVDPGEHLFMVVSEAADFMAADLAGGKTYYAIVTPRMGAWRARFSMSPVRNGGPGEFQYDSSEFRDWIADAEFSQNTPESYTWAKDNHSSVEHKQAEYWEVWQQKSAADLAERTMNPDDGI